MGYVSGLVEVHSVMIVMQQRKTRQVYGEFWALDAKGGRFYFFKKSKENAISLGEDGTLPLIGPRRCLTCPEFSFVLDLKDKDTDHEVCSGYFSSGYCILGWLYDKPLRLVCKGEHNDHAVMHMTPFSEAAQATVSVALVINEDKIQGQLPTIHGKLVTRYSEREYDDEFYKKYFQTVLLSAPKDGPGVLPEAEDRKNRFKIPLSRSVVAVSGNDSLYIQTDLDINFPDDTNEASKVNCVWSFAAAKRYYPKPCIEYRVLDNDYGRIEAEVSWVSDVWDLPFDGPA